jgi:hypothetical protein
VVYSLPFTTKLRLKNSILKIFLSRSFSTPLSKKYPKASMKLILAAMMVLSILQRNAMAFAPKFRSLSRPSVATFASRVTPGVASDEVVQLINSQVTVELSASQLYLSASIWCDQQELVGMAAYVSDLT